MTDYKAIIGKGVKVVTTNLDNAEGEGQIWFNSVTGEFKDIVSVEAWSSGGNLITARQAVGGIGTQSANLVVGGYVTAESALVEEYNGTGWVAGGALPAARQSGGGFGTQTAGVYAGGGVAPNSTATNSTQEYNGSSWTTTGNLNTTRDQTSGAGTETAGLCCGGTPNGSDQSNTSEEYNGSAWTAGNNLSFAARSVNNNSLGIQTAALLVGGNSDGATAGVQSYDGTNWTTTTSLPEARISLATSGTQTAGLAFGGNDGSNIENTNLKFDGSSWTALPTMSTARDNLGGSPSGTSAAAVASAGRQPGPANSSLTEEFNSSVNVITGAAWSSGGNLNTARGGTNNVSGDKSAAATFGGQTSSPSARSNATELYDGSSWTNGTNTPAARRSYLVAGTQTASLLCGGQPPTPTANGDAETFEFDGSSFSDTGDINNARDNAAGAGTQTAGLAVGGRTRPGSTFVPNNNVEEYNGSSWSNANTLPAANSSSTSATGPQTAAIFAMANPAYVASYDGTNWTAISATQAMPNSYTGTGVAGTSSSDAYMGGGEEPGGTRHGFVQKYDGTSWVTSASFSTGRNSFGYGGSSPAQIVCGGQDDTAFTNNTEEFTTESSALNVVTVSTS